LICSATFQSKNSTV